MPDPAAGCCAYRGNRCAAGIFETVVRFVRKEVLMRCDQPSRWSPACLVTHWVNLFCGYDEQPLTVVPLDKKMAR